MPFSSIQISHLLTQKNSNIHLLAYSLILYFSRLPNYTLSLYISSHYIPHSHSIWHSFSISSTHSQTHIPTLFFQINPLSHGREGAVRPPSGFLPFTQKIFRQPIPENSWLFSTFGCGYTYDFFSSKNLKICLYWVSQKCCQRV